MPPPHLAAPDSPCEPTQTSTGRTPRTRSFLPRSASSVPQLGQSSSGFCEPFSPCVTAARTTHYSTGNSRGATASRTLFGSGRSGSYKPWLGVPGWTVRPSDGAGFLPSCRIVVPAPRALPHSNEPRGLIGLFSPSHTDNTASMNVPALATCAGFERSLTVRWLHGHWLGSDLRHVTSFAVSKVLVTAAPVLADFRHIEVHRRTRG
jgi:hypothetical protein